MKDKRDGTRARALFKTDVIITEKEFKKFQHFYLNKFKNAFIPKLILIFLTTAAIAINVVKKKYFLVGLIIFLVIVYLIVLKVTINLQIKKKYQNSIKINMLKETLVFYDDYLESESSHSHLKIKYEDIWQICETRDNFYLFTSNREAFIIIKNNIDDLDGFKEFISTKAKYKRYYL